MYDRILVPVDGSPTSNRGLAEAIALATLTGSRIKLLHVFELPMLGIGTESALMRGEDIYNIAREAGQNVLSEAAARVKAAGIHVEQVLLDCEGRPLCDLVAEAVQVWSASLVVLGSHGRRGLKRMLLGSDAEQILRTSSVPVLLVRDSDPRTA
jgi:nucleotide-binding universal stress UspA family protein